MKKIFLSFVIFSAALAFVFTNSATAQENQPSLPGTIEGTSTHFQITDSSYLNINLDSTQSIKLSLQSVPEMITMQLEADPAISPPPISTQLTLSGLFPNTTYYLYQDNYHNEIQLIADMNGVFMFEQDLSQPHLVFIQPRKGTKFISDNTTGGDCQTIGTWNQSTKTCTLTQDVFETIQIDSDNITVDGNNRIITGSNTGSGIYLSGRTGVTIKNLTIKNFSTGIDLWSSHSNIIANNIISANAWTGITIAGYSTLNYLSTNTILTPPNPPVSIAGVYLHSYAHHNTIFNNLFYHPGISYHNNALLLNFSNNNLIIGNNFLNGNYGITLVSSPDNTLKNNAFSGYQVAVFLYTYYGFGTNKNLIYNNNFLQNSSQILLSLQSTDTLLNLPLPQGGNYWSNFDEPNEGCNDTNNDRICDSPYTGADFYNVGIKDNFPWTIQNGWLAPTNQAPTFLNSQQLKSDQTTQISENGITQESTVVFKATLQDPDNDQIKLQVELKEFAQSFDGQNLLESGLVTSDSEAVVSRQSLVDGSYKWRARAVDDQGNSSAWQEFGTAGNTDFTVNLPLSTKSSNLAKELVNYPYLLGGKGWDYHQNLFVSADVVKNGYYFYNASIISVDFGAGVDCSGLVMWAYDRSFDPNKSRFNNFVKAEGADEQYRYNTATTTESELQPGDVMFFDWDLNGFIDHVAMYVGGGDSFNIVQARSRQLGITSANKDNLKQQVGFVGFKQVISALPPAVMASAYSPVDLIVTDPDGFTITPTTTISSDLEYLREIPGVLYYSELEKGMDGNPVDQVYSYTAKTGDYTIQVLPAAGAPPTATYILDFSAGNQSITLAQDVPISQIPSQGYGITVSATGTINPFTPVIIDIKPGSYPNSINLGSNGVVPVSIFGSATFDVRQIDAVTSKLANASVKLKGNGQPMASYSDVNGDGFTDITVNVLTEVLELTANDVKADLEGRLIDGTIMKGSDSVRIVP